METQDEASRQTPSPKIADERTPLLAVAENNGERDPKNGSLVQAASGDGHDEDDNDDDENKKMPYVQVLVICYASIAEPIAYFCIFPFIAEMIRVTGEVDKDDVGFWAGLIESTFSLVQMVLMLYYGRLSDRIGRKPLLVFSLAGVTFATALFGLSASLWQMVLFRMIAGVFSGSSVTIRTMISENSNKHTQGRAFSWYMFARQVGLFLGPICGGGLANPAKQFPHTFGNIQFFVDFPYALPSFVAGAYCLSATVLAACFLKETLKLDGDRASKKEVPMSTYEILKSPGVGIVLYIYGHATLLGLAYTAICPVSQATDIEDGGFGFNPSQIALFLTVGGLSQAVWMLIAFPYLQARFGTGNTLRGCGVIWPIFMAIYPVLNQLLRHGHTTAFWVIGILAVNVGSGCAMGFACTQLCINDISPSPAVLGTLNGLALTVSTGIRAFAPIVFASLFAVGVKGGWMDGQLAWVVMVILAALLNVGCYFLPEKAEGRPAPKVAAEGSGEGSA